MAPTTRSATRRGIEAVADDDDMPIAPGRRVKRAKNTSKTEPESTKTGWLTDDRCRLLELPPELRNLIYGFALEQFGSPKHAPRLRRCAGIIQVKPWADRRWQAFGLTRTCKMLRVEFRPLWLRNLQISLDSLKHLDNLMKDFFPDEGDLQHAPKLVQILWDHCMDDTDVRKDITPLVRMRASASSTRHEFVPVKLADGESYFDDVCWYCVEQMDAEERGHDDWENSHEECFCFLEGMDPDDWEGYQYELIKSTKIVDKFISNGNAKWLDDVRCEKVSIQCIFGKSADPIKFRIKCKERFAQSGTQNPDEDHTKGAWNLIQAWGFTEMHFPKGTTFVIAFEAETKTMASYHELVNSEVREIRITVTK
ncbi:hypothetical protein FB567DRAFT_246202 [Paraphoma chrysanthemicola]|uniref:F-box domain-containing protein n=1 Tax=Paraphoma chrysanthemicola TaxID=798071 RepID=A0A8K0QTJ8_9PLEO|nr:hypothetical protein FB567DRAFT_246202 [Paraphoma chrysanthemicola]